MRFQRGQVLAALSNLGTAYNLININLAHVLIQNEYCGGDNCKEHVAVAGSVCMLGAIVGQLTFGYVGDCLGRGKALLFTQVLCIAGALVSAVAVPLDPNNGATVFVFIALARFVLGVGVGGVYPLSATISAEAADSENRGRQVAVVFSMQGVGTLMVPLLGALIVAIVGTPETRTATGHHIEGLSWRILLGMGAVPGLVLLPLNRPRGEQQPTNGARGRSVAPPSVMQALQTRSNWPKLVGCAGGWFLFDVTFYGNTIFQPTVLQVIFKADPEKGTPVDGGTLATNLCWQLAIVALIGLPGYYVACHYMDTLGRKVIQIQGFVSMALLYALLAIFLVPLEKAPVLLLLVYGLTYFFSNFGPNSTTFILPSETFPVEVRSTLNGVCAAAGKLGATLGSAGFKPLITQAGTGAAFWMCAVCALLGALVTKVFVQDMRQQDISSTGLICGANTEAGAPQGTEVGRLSASDARS